MPENIYHAWPLASHSRLAPLCAGGTPAHYKAALDDDSDSESMRFGRWAHIALLEPERLDQTRPLPPGIKRRRGPEWEQLCAENEGITFLPPSEWAKVEPMITKAKTVRDNLLEHAIVGDLVRRSKKEVTLIWTDETTGVRCKGRPDMIGNDLDFIADLKTTTRLTRFEAVRASYYKGATHLQSAMYTDALIALTKKGPVPFRFIFVTVAPPHCVFTADGHAAVDERASYESDPAGYYRIGHEQYKDALKTIADCDRRGLYEGFPLEEMEMVIPRNAGRD